MKKILKKICLIIIFFLIVKYNFSQSLVNNSTNEINRSIDSLKDMTIISGNDFFKKYDINSDVYLFGKILKSTKLHINPECNSDTYNVTLPKQDKVIIYKLMNTEIGCWAVKYKNFYGFINSSAIMPITPKTLNNSIYDKPPVLLSLIRPKYPKIARKNDIKGKVILKVLVDKNGKVEEVKINEGIPELNNAAITAVKEAKFKPASHNGNPVPTWIMLSIDFD